MLEVGCSETVQMKNRVETLMLGAWGWIQYMGMELRVGTCKWSRIHWVLLFGSSSIKADVEVRGSPSGRENKPDMNRLWWITLGPQLSVPCFIAASLPAGGWSSLPFPLTLNLATRLALAKAMLADVSGAGAGDVLTWPGFPS